jgi:DNA-binding SARP family transcriptional activator
MWGQNAWRRIVPRVRVGVLGATDVSLDGEAAHLTPRTVRVLLRLIAAEGEAVAANEIYRDLWGLPPRGMITRSHRNEVQKRVHELRQKMEPDGAGRILMTERLLGAREPQSAYRLVLDAEQLDCRDFASLVSRAASAGAATTVALCARALALWRGSPLADVAGEEFAVPLARRLEGLRVTALRELARAQAELGRPDLALPVADQLAALLPGDAGAARTLEALREEVRGMHPDDLLRREFPGLGVTVVVRCGDMFEQDDANLAMGFGDTFDTAIADDAVISRDSVQGQLLDRLYGGDRRRLDADLRRGLRGVEAVRVENAHDKPRGKRVRYPVGTVVPLPMDGRRVFGFVHCRQDLDLVTHSTPAELRLGLEQLWRSVRQYGLLRPVAIPLAGSGLARVAGLTREQLMILIIDTFLTSCRDARCASELRIVLRKSQVGRMRISDVARFVETLDREGREPHA